jgi:hypothetical protein
VSLDVFWFSVMGQQRVLLFYGGEFMINIAHMGWKTDVEAMTCRNEQKKITVSFEKEGEAIRGRISDMPFGLINECVFTRDGLKILQNVVVEAEEVFLAAYFENEGVRVKCEQ